MSSQRSIALRYHEHGKPLDVLQLEENALPDPGSGEVRLRSLAAAIHPSDFGMIGGSYGKLRELPAVAGREGIAEIKEVGPGVTGWKTGDRVSIPDGTGAWMSACNVAAGTLGPRIPRDLPVDQVAMAMINPPTAWRLLHDFEYLSEGDWIVQNAANSAVGVSVIQLARHLGLRTLNVVRREELIEPLKAMGADVVVTDDRPYWKELPDLTAGAKPRLALNSVGGESAINQIKALDDGGVHVTFGGMSFEEVRFPTRFLIFNRVSLTGFWLDQWIRSKGKDACATMMKEVYGLIEAGVFHTPVAARYPLEEWKDAIEQAMAPRLGKVLFVAKG